MIQISPHNQIGLYNGKIKLKFVPLFRQFIHAAGLGEVLTPGGDRYRDGTLRMYRQTLGLLETYEDRYGSIYINDITGHWGELFTAFLSKYKISKNTIGRHLCRVKAVLNRAYKAGLTLRTGYGIVIRSEPAFTVFNTLQELRKMSDLDLRLVAGLERVRDVYVLNCFLGLRWSDLSRFIEEPLKFIKEFDGAYYIDLEAIKTGNKSIIPIGNQVSYILKKRRFDFGAKFSAQYYNYSIKHLAKMAGLTSKHSFEKTVGGEKVMVEKQKWQMMSSHTARRTFVSLCVMADLNQQSIMKMTGHRSESSFQGYVRISQLQNAVKLSNHEFFKIKL